MTRMLCDDKQAGEEHLLMFFTQEALGPTQPPVQWVPDLSRG
jgi:hypothetical protein